MDKYIETPLTKGEGKRTSCRRLRVYNGDSIYSA